MNICFVNTTKEWGGGEKWHLENAIILKKRGENVSVITNKNSILQQRALKNNVSHFIINSGNLSFLNPFKILHLVRYFNTNNTDAVILNGPNDLKLAGIAAKIAGVRKIVYRRGIGVPIKNKLLNRLLLKRVVTQIIANSESTKNLILKNLNQVIPEKKIVIIYNGFDFSDKDIDQKQPSLSKSKIVLGNAGRLSKEKGQHYLIELAIRLKQENANFEIQVAGTGELFDDLKNKIEEQNLNEQVKLVGFKEDVPSFMKGLDIFLLSSVIEGFGFVLIEAMSQKLPVVAFKTGSIPEIVDDGKTGFITEAGDVDAFYNAVVKLMNSKQLRESFGEYGYQLAESKFNIQKTTYALINLLKG